MEELNKKAEVAEEMEVLEEEGIEIRVEENAPEEREEGKNEIETEQEKQSFQILSF